MPFTKIIFLIINRDIFQRIYKITNKINKTRKELNNNEKHRNVLLLFIEFNSIQNIHKNRDWLGILDEKNHILWDIRVLSKVKINTNVYIIIFSKYLKILIFLNNAQITKYQFIWFKKKINLVPLYWVKEDLNFCKWPPVVSTPSCKYRMHIYI